MCAMENPDHRIRGDVRRPPRQMGPSQQRVMKDSLAAKQPEEQTRRSYKGKQAIWGHTRERPAGQSHHARQPVRAKPWNAIGKVIPARRILVFETGPSG